MAQKLCPKYFDMTPSERSIFMGQLIHVVQSDDAILELAVGLIELGVTKNLFDGTTILPDTTDTD